MARACILLMLLTAACSRSRLNDGLPAKTDCTGCHGQNDDPTPPPAVNGSMSTKDIAVGAHQIHMKGSDLAGPVECGECHILPMLVDGNEHPDPLGRPAAVDFGNLARNDSASPVWDRKAQTCAGTFCHGSTLRGAKDRAAPVWTRLDGSNLECTACHGNPPGESHPQEDKCEKCHGDETSGAPLSVGGVIKIPALHVNGMIDLIPQP